MDLAALFSLVLNGEPLIDSSAHGKGRDLDGGFTNQVTSGNIFVENLDNHVVSNVLDVNVEGLVPLWRFTRTLEHVGLILLLASRDDAVGIHFTEELSITSELRFDNFEPKGS